MPDHGPARRRLHYACLKCPAYCCSYPRITVYARDLDRLARHFGTDRDNILRRFTKIRSGERVLRHHRDDVFPSVCVFFDCTTRRCGVYEARPAVCREYPEESRCGYYQFLRWEREHQADPELVPLKRVDFE